MPRLKHPDYKVDPDRGQSRTSAKQATLMDVPVYQDREQTRAGLRDLDSMVEGTPGLNRLQRDRERIFPRETNAALGHPVMQRRLPAPSDVRVPISARQRNQRSRQRRAVQERMPLAQLQAQHDLVSTHARWSRFNQQLSDAAGDVQALPEADQQQIRRVDRAIQSYERGNDRGHVLYSNVLMPAYINASNADGFVARNFAPGRRLEFDRFTQATHQLHETRDQVGSTAQAVTFEIETRRGAYLGQSDKRDNTQHLLPRGMQFEVVGSHQASFIDRSGRRQQCMVVQLRDATTEPTEPSTSSHSGPRR